MNIFKEYYNNIVLYDLLLKSSFQSYYQIPKLKKIYLNFGLKNLDLENKKKIISILLILELITNQKPFLTKSKKNKIHLKIKKGMIIGCKLTLQKKKMYIFFTKLFFFILPNKKEFKGFLIKKNLLTLNFQIQNILNFLELESEFLRFQKIPSLDISIHTTAFNKEVFLLLLKNLQLSIFKK